MVAFGFVSWGLVHSEEPAGERGTENSRVREAGVASEIPTLELVPTSKGLADKSVRDLSESKATQDEHFQFRDAIGDDVRGLLKARGYVERGSKAKRQFGLPGLLAGTTEEEEHLFTKAFEELLAREVEKRDVAEQAEENRQQERSYSISPGWANGNVLPGSDAVRGLREAAFQIEVLEHRLELLEIYEAADRLQVESQRLRVEARLLRQQQLPLPAVRPGDSQKLQPANNPTYIQPK